MARARYPRDSGPLPPPLPPETRTVGQLVAETLRLYGQRFWAALPLGLAPAASGLAVAELPPLVAAVLLPTAGTVVMAAAFVGASALALDVRPRGREAIVALAAGVVAFLPVLLQRVLVLPGFDLVALAYFALVGLAVPAALAERLGLRSALARGVRLARVDYVHALGGLATLAITIFLTGLVLFVLLESFGESTVRIAAFLAILVLAPLFLLGAALLYVDQAARDAAGKQKRGVRKAARRR